MNIKLSESKNELRKLLKPNGMVTFRVGAMKVTVSEYDDSFYAFDTLCPHSGADLSKGVINHLGEVVCPLHNYQFRLIDGEVNAQRCSSLKTYEILTSSEGVFLINPRLTT